MCTVAAPLLRALFALMLALAAATPAAADDKARAFVDAQIAAHTGKTGVYVLDTGVEALLARAWMVEQARHSIEVQYFIWSTDNIGILAAEALLRAAERGVKVRVIVDDLLIDAPDRSLLALARHPNIDIRIYNPKSSVGVLTQQRLYNAATDFRGLNQRMHDKTFVVDGQLAITGGRNMAAEYFDYHTEYNFRDRDVLLLGPAAGAVRGNFEAFWRSELAVPVERLYDGLGLMQKNVSVDDAAIREAYRELREYARSPANFAPEVRAAIDAAPASFERLARSTRWVDVEFIHDRPGKNEQRFGLQGGGSSSAALAKLLQGARQRVVIQSPYLVVSDEALALLRELRTRGVEVRISTNSLASTDNLPAFSGYRNQRCAIAGDGTAHPRVQAGARGEGAAHPAPDRDAQAGTGVLAARQDDGHRRPHGLHRHLQLRPSLAEPQHRGRRRRARRGTGGSGGSVDRDRHGAGQQLGRGARRPGLARLTGQAQQGAPLPAAAAQAFAVSSRFTQRPSTSTSFGPNCAL
jgi:cardiolipin synthase C